VADGLGRCFYRQEVNTLAVGTVTTCPTKAGMLFYLLIKDHPFQNGNKRIAIIALIVFLLKNDQWLEADMMPLYRFTVWVAKSKPEDKDFVIPLSNSGSLRRIVSKCCLWVSQPP